MQCLLSVDECVTIGSVQINVLEVWHDSVKLGINDPNASPRYREEVVHETATTVKVSVRANRLSENAA